MRNISQEEVRQHSSSSDLWISIHGKVYDVSRWADDHPGGSIPLLNLAGQDATDAFSALHPPSAWKHLDRFFIGCQVASSNPRAPSSLSSDYQLLLSSFTKQGLFDERPHSTLLRLCAVLSLFTGAILLLVGSQSLAAGLLMGLAWTQAGWLAHDSGHASSAGWLNRIVQLISGNVLTGVSILWWKRTHNAHHVACNSLDFDPDLQHIPIFAVSSELFRSLTSVFYKRELRFGFAAKLLVSYQHLTFYPVMCFARLNLFAQSIALLLTEKKSACRAQEIIGLMLFWVWYPCLVLTLLPNNQERLLFVAACFGVTGVQHVLFCLSHFSAAVYVGQPQGEDWCKEQVTGSLNISCSPWMDWFYGGIQFQAEHHLFPRMPRNHLRRIAPQVRELCKKHGLAYNTAGFWEANRRTLVALRIAAMQARRISFSAIG